MTWDRVNVMVELSMIGGEAGGVSKPARFFRTWALVPLDKLGMLSIRDIEGLPPIEGTGGTVGTAGGSHGYVGTVGEMSGKA